MSHLKNAHSMAQFKGRLFEQAALWEAHATFLEHDKPAPKTPAPA